MDLPQLLEKQISLTEWFAQLNHQQTDALRLEDNDKRERLRVLHEVISLSFDQPHQFSAQEIATRSPAFQQFLNEHGDELCALRLIPLQPELPKLRMRGLSVRDALQWFSQQKVDPAQYRADFIPHPTDHLWSTIFVVNEAGIHGEIIHGGHQQLTQGFHSEGEPITFSYDFTNWQLSPDNPETKKHLQEIVAAIYIPDREQRQQLQKILNSKFSHNYLQGYFETVTSKEFGIWFIDYNRLLGELLGQFSAPVPSPDSRSLLRGQIGSSGQATGRARLVLPEQLVGATLNSGDILVCPMTTPEYLPLMRSCAAIVTDQGGILSHAAIVARELGKPCVVGTKIATKILKDGDVVEVDANHGLVRILKKR